jgi:UDP-N-acetylmuramoyl-tripeptide--D-alanyl-D-alanine ligase
MNMLSISKWIIVRVLTWEARMVLKRYHPKIIAVTGSVGKTTTKDAIAHLIGGVTHKVRRSEKSFNSEIGVPLTILGLPNRWRSISGWFINLLSGLKQIIIPVDYPDTLVLEVGADHPGDIGRITEWLVPDVAVITRLPERPVHVAHFSSPEDVRKEKIKLFYALAKNGVFVGNADDPYVDEVAKNDLVKKVMYGWENSSIVRGRDLSVRYEMNGKIKVPIGTEFYVEHEGRSLPVFLSGVLGSQSASALLGAFAVGIAIGRTLDEMAVRCGDIELPRGRMRIIPGKNSSTIVDDSYNSSPVAVEAALQALEDLEGARKIAILGDMLELGKFTDDEHLRAGRRAASTLELLFTVGRHSTLMDKGAIEGGMDPSKVKHFSSGEEAASELLKLIVPGDIILVKGSQGSGEGKIRLERAVKMLMQEPDRASMLLVRQEDEWAIH